MEIEHERTEKKDLIKQLTKYRVELQMVVGHINLNIIMQVNFSYVVKPEDELQS